MGTAWHDDDSLEAQKRPQLQAEVNRFHAHLRAFFWELVAAFEAMHIWGVEKHGRATSQLAELEKARRRRADWCAEIRDYRNFAHRCFLVSVGEYGVPNRQLASMALMSVRKGGTQYMVPERLDFYRNQMHGLFERVKQI